VKPGFEQPIDQSVYEKTVGFFTELMQLLHPIMPFVTEEIYHQLKERNDDLCVKQFAPATKVDASVLQQGELLKQTISAIRDARVKNNIKPKDVVTLYIQSDDAKSFSAIQSILSKQINAQVIQFVQEPKPNTINVVVGPTKFFVETETELDVTSQKEQLLKDLDYQKGFLASVEKKLRNERFVQNAKPEVVELERRKKADAEQKIKALEESLSSIS
jgi:valyl-tRNA synthetase